ncbi:MAG TPA: hypothetical protein VFW65_20375 [Pseudonocardiaceae bacterium]|nr:hypothetical protein [Pseudonocardiaceae bacterium]
MEDDRPDTTMSKRGLMVLALGVFVLDVLISGYMQIAVPRWNVTLLTFVGLLVLDALILVPAVRKIRPKPERSGSA